MFDFEILNVKPLSTKKLGKISIQKYEIRYKTMLQRIHTVVIELLKFRDREAIVVNDSFSTHSDFISYISEKFNIPIITPSEIPRFVSN